MRPVLHSNVPVALGIAAVLTGCSQQRPTTAESQDREPLALPAIDWAPEQYVVHRSPLPLQVDGMLDDPEWGSARWTSDFIDIEGQLRPLPRFRTRVKMLWDDVFFYVAAEMEEPHVWGVLTERDAVIYYDNDFEVFIDPDGDTHEYYELEINALGTVWDLFLVKPYRDGGPALNAWDIQGLRTGVSVDGTLNDPSDIDRGWTVEIAIPWDVLAEAANMTVPPADGDMWRVNFSRVQWRADIANGQYVKVEEPAEGRTRPEDNWVWSPQGLIAMHYPEMWGMVQFSDVAAGEREVEFVPRVEDEARWFLRTVYYKQHLWYSANGEFSADADMIGIEESLFDLELHASANQFDASVLVNGKKLRIGRDGRIW